MNMEVVCQECDDDAVHEQLCGVGVWEWANGASTCLPEAEVIGRKPVNYGLGCCLRWGNK